MSDSDLEESFLYLTRVLSLPTPEREARFDPVRKWLFDFLWRKPRVAVEIEGGTWKKNGRHTSGKGYANDCEKYNAAALAGYMVLRFTSDMLKDGRAVKTLEDVRGLIEDEK
jgi:very-short-patch-repair endonuclease